MLSLMVDKVYETFRTIISSMFSYTFFYEWDSFIYYHMPPTKNEITNRSINFYTKLSNKAKQEQTVMKQNIKNSKTQNRNKEHKNMEKKG